MTEIRDAQVLPKVRAKAISHAAMRWQDMPGFFDDLRTRDSMAAKALMFTCLTACRTSEVLGMRWAEVDDDLSVWTCPAERMKAGEAHRVPLTPEMLAILEPLRAIKSDVVFEGQKRHTPLSNMAMLMLLRRMGSKGVTVHGFRSTFRDWASEVAGAPREVAELSLAHRTGTKVEQAYARSDLLDRRRALLQAWCAFVAGTGEIREG